MLKIPWFKIVAVLAFVVMTFHFSGAEIIFCKDNAKVTAATHSCSTCSHNHQVVAVKDSVQIPTAAPIPNGFVSYEIFRPQEPSFSFFRPPITR